MVTAPQPPVLCPASTCSHPSASFWGPKTVSYLHYLSVRTVQPPEPMCLGMCKPWAGDVYNPIPLPRKTRPDPTAQSDNGWEATKYLQKGATRGSIPASKKRE